MTDPVEPTTTPPQPRPTAEPGAARSRPRGLMMIMVLAVGVALAVGVVLRPTPGSLPAGIVGDRQLADLGRQVVGTDRPALALACVTPDRTRTAVIGAGADDRFELGSVSKGLTGLLFQTMIDNGEVDPEATVGSILPVRGPLAEVTLLQLATHRSGLPSLATGPAPTARTYWSTLTAANPYERPVDQMLAEAQATPLTAPPGTYSNLGFEVLGVALTTVAKTDYADLLRDRVLQPLGMDSTLAPTSTDELTDADLIGRTSGGRRADPWLGTAITPVGGVRADIADTARLAQGLVTGRVPGVGALRPRADEGASKIGLAWMTTPVPDTGQTVIWHNGATGGFTSFVGIDRDSGTGVVVLSAVQGAPDQVTSAGFTLLERMKGCRS